MKYLFTLSTSGRISDKNGELIAMLSDSSYISDFLLGVRAVSGPIEGNIIREGDIEAWETATVKRLTGGHLKNTGRPVTPQVPALPGMSPMGFRPC